MSAWTREKDGCHRGHLGLLAWTLLFSTLHARLVLSATYSVTICNHATLTFENGSSAASTSEFDKHSNNDIRHFSSPYLDPVAISRGPKFVFQFQHRKSIITTFFRFRSTKRGHPELLPLHVKSSFPYFATSTVSYLLRRPC